MASVTLPPPPPLASPAPAPAPEQVRALTPLAAAAPEPVARPIKPLSAAPAVPAAPSARIRKPLRAEKPVPSRVPKAVQKKIAAPAPKQTPKPNTKPVAKPRIKEAPLRVSSVKANATGRPLLRLLEHGRGPSLEIAWPGDRRDRDRLHTLFAHCFGMRVAVLDGDGRLFDDASPRGTPWDINTDLFSGFVRRFSGGGPARERRTVNRIRDRHGLPGGASVRIFPRNADAVLLGGLHQLIGNRYLKAGRIRAAYRLSHGRVGVTDIDVDGVPVPGSIDFSAAARRGCVL